MRRLVAIALVLSSTVAASQQQPPRFRGGVEIIQLDVAVLDAQRRPVPNLAAGDFTVLEDGKPQPIVAFQELSAPDPDGSLVPWMRDVAPDVRTNSAGGRRVFVLVLDDASLGDSPQALAAVDSVKKVAHAFVDRMGPADQVCIVFTGDNRLAQDFTSDRAALRAVIDRFKSIFIPPYLRMLYSSGTVKKVAESLTDVSHRRKALIYIGTGLRLGSTGQFAQFGMSDPNGLSEAASTASIETRNAIERAQRANVTIYTINPFGLQVAADEAAHIDMNAVDDALLGVANDTGGFSVTRTNSFDAQVGQIFRETGSYYLLGFQSGYVDGKFRRVTVKVNRPGVTVRTRSGYYAPKPEKPDKPAPPLFKAMAGVLPNPDMYMRAAVAPFAVGEKKLGGVAIALGLSQPAPGGERVSHVIDLLTSAFTREGKPVAQRRQTARLMLRPSEAGDAKYEIVSRLDLKPGRYNLRFAVHIAALGKSGSVYSEVDIPNYEKDKLSLSGVVVSVAQGLMAAGKDMLAGLVPQAPTTQRGFAAGDQVTVFLRVYQGGNKPALPVIMRAIVKDGRDATVFESRLPLEPARFGAAREADFSMTLPTATLAPGPYLLTIEAAVDEKTSARREVRFSIR